MGKRCSGKEFSGAVCISGVFREGSRGVVFACGYHLSPGRVGPALPLWDGLRRGVNAGVRFLDGGGDGIGGLGGVLENATPGLSF